MSQKNVFSSLVMVNSGYIWSPNCDFEFIKKVASRFVEKYITVLRTVFLLKMLGTTFSTVSRGPERKIRFLFFHIFYFYFNTCCMLAPQWKRPTKAQYSIAANNATTTHGNTRAIIRSWCLRCRSSSSLSSLCFLTNSESSGEPSRLWGIAITIYICRQVKIQRLYCLMFECSSFEFSSSRRKIG